MDNDIETEQTLRGLYYNPATGYQSADRLYNKALEEGLNVLSHASLTTMTEVQNSSAPRLRTTPP